jgi:hypothetical protein
VLRGKIYKNEYMEMLTRREDRRGRREEGKAEGE